MRVRIRSATTEDAPAVVPLARSAVLVTVATRRAGAFYLSAGYEETAVLFWKLP